MKTVLMKKRIVRLIKLTYLAVKIDFKDPQ